MTCYIAHVHKDPKSDYGVSFPDFPGCISAGSTPEEAYEMAQEALQGHIETMMAYDDPIPKPMSFAQARRHEFFKDSILTFLVNVTLPGKVKRVNIAMDENLLKAIDDVTRNRSAFLAEAARRHLQEMR